MNTIIEKTSYASSRFLIINLMNRGLGFFFIIVISRNIPQESFGIYVLAVSVAGIFQIVGAFGLPVAIQKFLSGEKKEYRYLGSVLLLGAVFAFISTLGLYILSRVIAIDFYHNPKLLEPLKLISFSVFFTILYTINKAILQSKLKMRSIAIYDLVRQILKIIVVFLILNISKNINLVIISLIISISLSYLLSLNSIIRMVGIKNISIRNDEIRAIFNYSLPLLFVGISYFLAYQTDRLMIGSMLDTKAVGIYAVASNIAMFSSMFRGPFVNAFMPLLTNIYQKQKFHDMKILFLFLIKWPSVFLGALVILYFGWGKNLIEIFGKDYVLDDTYLILLVLGLGTYFSNLFGPIGSFLQLTNGNKLEFINSIIFVISNIFFNYFFITKFGLIGAAFATVIAEIIFNFIRIVEIYHREKFIILSFNSIMFSIIIILIGIVIFHFDSLIWQKILSVLFVLFFLWTNFKTMSKEEKMFLLNFKLKIWR